MDIDIDYTKYSDPTNLYQHTRYPEHSGFTDNGHTLWLKFPDHDHEQPNASWDLVKSGHGKQDELYQRVRFNPEHLFDKYMHTCRFWNAAMHLGPQAAGGIDGEHTGADGWSVRLYTQDYADTTSGPFGLKVYLYHMDMEPTYGTEYHVDQPLFERGKFHTLETYVKKNTVTNGSADRNGEVRVWLDGENVFDMGGFRFDSRGDQGAHVAGPVMRYGGPELPPQTVYQYYRDHSINFGMPDESGSAYDEPTCVRNIVSELG